jgi:hypothetical protein
LRLPEGRASHGNSALKARSWAEPAPQDLECNGAVRLKIKTALPKSVEKDPRFTGGSGATGEFGVTPLKPARERGELGSDPQDNPTMALTPGDGDDNKDYSRCISDWDAATYMTKQEWRAACRRALKDYPGAFRR